MIQERIIALLGGWGCRLATTEITTLLVCRPYYTTTVHRTVYSSTYSTVQDRTGQDSKLGLVLLNRQPAGCVGSEGSPARR